MGENYNQIINAILISLTIISISYSLFAWLKTKSLKNEIKVMNEDLHKTELVLDNLNKRVDSLRITNHENRKNIRLIKELADQNKCSDIVEFINDNLSNSYCNKLSDTHNKLFLQNIAHLDSVSNCENSSSGKMLDYNNLNSFKETYKTDSSKVLIIANSVMETCSRNNIDYKYYIGDPNMVIGVSFSDLNSIIGNVLENSIRALKNKEIASENRRIDKNTSSNIDTSSSKNNARYIRMNIYDDTLAYFIEITNNEPQIENIDAIFKKGHTDSKNPDRGLGLYICKILIEKYKGHIYVESNKINTKFTIIIPKDF